MRLLNWSTRIASAERPLRLGQGVRAVLLEPPGRLGVGQAAPGVGLQPSGDLFDGERVPGRHRLRRGRAPAHRMKSD